MVYMTQVHEREPQGHLENMPPEDTPELPPDPVKFFKREFKRRLNAAKALHIKLNKQRAKQPPFDSSLHRSNVSEMFAKVLDNSKNATFVEKGIINFTVSVCKGACEDRSWDNSFFRRLYDGKVRNLVFNLQNPNNPQLFQRLHNKELKYSQLATLTHRQLFPELYLEFDQQKRAREESIKRNTEKYNAMLGDENGMFRCEKCKSWTTTYYSLQTRSADEPMTNYITCLKCNNKWKC